MSTNGEDQNSVEGTAEVAEPREPVWQRLASACSSSAAAAGGATVAAFSAAKDGLDSLKYGAHKSAVKMDKWAADGVVRGCSTAGGSGRGRGVGGARTATCMVAVMCVTRREAFAGHSAARQQVLRSAAKRAAGCPAI